VINTQQTINDVTVLSSGKRVWLAFSGGVDSHVLLHILATSQHPELTNIGAIYIDHGLQKQSSDWAKHCADICADLDVDFQCLTVEVANIEKLGMEAAARAARYQAMQDFLSDSDVLLTAQHQHDQAETLFLQLLRGAGPKGLAAMGRCSSLGQLDLIRPLLDISQQDILSYAHQYELSWIEDPSNTDTRWSRNYLRHNVWPIIEQRWPQAATTLSRSAQHCAEASELLAELAEQDMLLLDITTESPSLPIEPLMTLSSARQRNLLRHVIELKKLNMPSATVLQCVIDEVCLAAQDCEPLVSWLGVEVRRFQNRLYFMPPLKPHQPDYSIPFKDCSDISLQNCHSVGWKISVGEGLPFAKIEKGLRVGFRQGGERIQLHGQSHHKSLKHLFQQWHIPPWKRDRIPLIFCKDKLVAIVGYGVSEGYAVSSGEQGYLPTLKSNY